MPLPPLLPDRVTGLGRRLRRLVLARRRLLAALCAAIAVLAGLRATAAPAAPMVAVSVAARDLPAGTRLASTDVRVVRYAPGTAPDGRIRDPVGRTLAGPVRRGEAVTDAGLIGPALARASPDQVAVPVRLSDAAMVGLLRVGDRIDVIATDPQTGTTSILATHAVVLALPPVGSAGDVSASAAGLPGRLVVLGTSPSVATAVSGASVAHFLTFAYSH